MRIRLSGVCPQVALLLAVCVSPSVTLSQNGAARPPQAAAQSNPVEGSPVNADSTATPDTKHLETIQAAGDAADEITPNLIRSYGYNPNTVPDVSAETHRFNLKLLNVLGSPAAKPVGVGPASQPAAVAQGTAQAATQQTNKQTGATPSSDGSTSATEKTSITQLLSIAVEDGAITNDVSGNTMTLNTSIYALANGLAKLHDMQQNYDACPFCTHLGLSATFNITNTSDQLANASRKQVSQAQAKYSFKDTSLRSKRVNDYYECKNLPKGEPCSDIESASLKMSEAASNPETAQIYQLDKDVNAVVQSNWSKFQAALKQTPQATRSQLDTMLLQLLDTSDDYQADLTAATGTKALMAAAANFGSAHDAYTKAQAAFNKQLSDLSKGFNGDLTFGEQFPTTTTSSSNGSSSSTGTVLGIGHATATSTSTPKVPDYLIAGLDLSCDYISTSHCTASVMPSWTVNLAGSFYTNPNPALNETSWRGATAALALQWSLGSGPFIKDPNDKSKVTISFSGKYQRLQENQHQAGKKADIALGNVKLEIPISSGVSFPLSMTVANSAEQVKETYVRGNFGVSFDLDKLAALLQAK